MHSAFSNRFASYLFKLMSGIAFKYQYYVEDDADDDDDVDALVFTISLVLISSGLVLCNLLSNKKCPCINL